MRERGRDVRGGEGGKRTDLLGVAPVALRRGRLARGAPSVRRAPRGSSEERRRRAHQARCGRLHVPAARRAPGSRCGRFAARRCCACLLPVCRAGGDPPLTSRPARAPQPGDGGAVCPRGQRACWLQAPARLRGISAARCSAGPPAASDLSHGVRPGPVVAAARAPARGDLRCA